MEKQLWSGHRKRWCIYDQAFERVLGRERIDSRDDQCGLEGEADGGTRI